MPPALGRPERDQAVSAMRDMSRLAADILRETPNERRVLDQLPENAMLNPRSGLRRWVFRSNHDSTFPHQRIDWAVVELHHDGSVALAVRPGALLPLSSAEAEKKSGARWFPTRVVDAAMAEAVALAASHVRSLGGVGTNMVRAQVLRSERDEAPLMAVDNRLGGGAHVSEFVYQVAGARALRRVLPVEAQFTAHGDVATLRNVARQLADDLNQQFGVLKSTVPV